MPSAKTTRVDVFPEGTTVNAYLASNWSQAQLPPSGAPQGASSGSAAMTGGVATITGLLEDRAYYLYALVGGEHRYVRQVVDSVSSLAAQLSYDQEFAPNPGIYATLALTLTAQRGYLMRWVPKRDRNVLGIAFAVTTGSATDDEVAVSLMDSQGNRLGGSGAVLGKLNGAAGRRFVAFTAPVPVSAGVVYFAALSCGASAAPGAIVGAAPFSVGMLQLYGTALPDIGGDAKANMHPLSAAWGAPGALSSQIALVGFPDS